MLRAFIKRVLPPRQRIQLRLLAFRIRGWLYRGQAVHCPICEGSFRRFLPFGNGPDRREAAECPSCHALERNRLLWLYLQREVAVQQPREQPFRVLHMAPSPGLQKRLHRSKGVRYRSADLIWPLADDHVDLQALPYADATFDLILCSHVLAHVENDRLALDELYRVLAPGGAVLLQSQIFPTPTTIEAPPSAEAETRATLLGDASRYRNYGADHDSRVAAAGFDVLPIDYAEHFSQEEHRYLGLAHTGLIYRCQR